MSNVLYINDYLRKHNLRDKIFAKEMHRCLEEVPTKGSYNFEAELFEDICGHYSQKGLTDIQAMEYTHQTIEDMWEGAGWVL